ncbi:hTAFII28-like protein conserved region-domain-containing protein [Radiomyces spectabilis]|uniref:hTAFII28-like protein conserved region-domain-containing protein n=1 Tax=Radiomyces spectabilis TaxID=64574 RepID=UPI00221F56F6|nr:hTAFII28-like protein conserved region-domain-containing protein [Radiomyces spectabilis]KAI8394204.1 hTAFII28-like protein conserved region-domain-containing protein [Radiomyces spectabilis]
MPMKRKSTSQAASPPPPKKGSSSSLSHSLSSHGLLSSSPSHGRPMTTAAAAAAAIRRTASNTSINNWAQRRSSGGTAASSRQGSVETDREGSVPNTVADEEQEQQTPNEAETSQQQQQQEDNEDDDENKEDLVMDMDAHMQAQMEKAKEDMKLLLENFTDDQLQRYEGYRRSALNRTNVKRLVSQVLNQQCSQTMAFVVAGFSKVYVGEIIEKAREVMEELGDTGAIRPEHLREAHRRYKQSQTVSSTVGKKLFRR